MSEAMEDIRVWVASLRADVEVVKAVLEHPAAPAGARKLAAGALGYLLSRMDLIPDWNRTIGIIDDVMVLRVCMDLAAGCHPMAAFDEELQVEFARLTNQVDLIRDFLGAELFAHLRRHCERLPDEVVRARSPARLLGDEAARAALYADIEAELAHLPVPSFADPEDVALRLKSYLHHKLDVG